MPVRTVVEEFCDVCFNQDGTETVATDRLRFGWQGRDYLLLTCDQHVEPIRDQLHMLSELASPDSAGRRGAQAGLRQARTQAAPRPASKTAFSQLSAEEKARFRAWAGLPSARRIADGRVEEWIAAGKP